MTCAYFRGRRHAKVIAADINGSALNREGATQTCRHRGQRSASVTVNEETRDRNRTPGLAAILSTVILLVTYALVVTSIPAFAGSVFTHLLLLMVLSSAAAATQTTILPTARTTLLMAAYKALPDSFAKTHPRYMTPTVPTIAMGGVSVALYAAMNYMSSGALIIADAVIAIGLFIAFYYGLTGFACVWYYRKNLTRARATYGCRASCPSPAG